MIKEKFGGSIKNIHQTTWYKRKNKRFEFDKTIVIMDQNCVLELDDDYCEILHDGNQPEFVEVNCGYCYQV